MDGTGECKGMQCESIEDVKHRMVGGEGEYARGRREDCALGVIRHGHCRERARMCSSIVACAAEQEEEREYMELLKNSFGIGQQCGSANANAKRKASIKQEGQRRRGNASGGARSGRDGRDERQKVGRRWMSNYCAGYCEVDWLLTLYVEGQCSQLSGIIARSEAQRGHRNSRLERQVQ
ncbi:uncharacterized protein FOMMEDRAFT_162658 [Fomitiporia mediterranea MF3/22]|uniref:Uncharacterized protein n=1 Tax=Fomitiporia mediterranea (strain MF3/22) TaxID=694068 RepID=R7SGU3_FOMME|nr:uncharacterized protein FOMMEDRAFT_162658 [Fomitiporia mediterranea MF3/22]EJC97635.1 hypothetical protein FOMMEDRAFT_162658 [Fomitiporia mediterranea MF3/22]